MSIVTDLVAASAALHDPTSLSNEDYDHRLRDHIAYVRQLMSKKDLGSIAYDQALLNASQHDLHFASSHSTLRLVN
jgi:COP9 signalosome complex subunit 3